MKLPRFSLKTLFALVTILALPCAWFAFELNKARHTRAVVAEIRKLYVGASGPKDGVITKLSAKRNFNDSEFEQLLPLLKELPTVQILDLSETAITTKHWKELSQFQSLTVINLIGAYRLTNKDIQELETAMPHTRIEAYSIF